MLLSKNVLSGAATLAVNSWSNIKQMKIVCRNGFAVIKVGLEKFN